MTAVVVGASAGLGRALAAELAARGEGLLLVASDARDLEALARDLRLRFEVPVEVVAGDAKDPDRFAESVAVAATRMSALRYLLLPIGAVSEADHPLVDGATASRLVNVNLLAVCGVVRALVPRLLESGGKASIVGFGSVAAARGRTRNAIYAAAKRALESYFESLRHWLEPQGVTVAFYTLGYLDTGLAYGLPLPFSKADPAGVARDVCRQLGQVRGKRFRPRYWRLVGWALEHLPWVVFGRLRA